MSLSIKIMEKINENMSFVLPKEHKGRNMDEFNTNLNELYLYKFALLRLIDIENYIDIIISNKDLPFYIKETKINKYSLSLSIISSEQKDLHFSISCPINTMKIVNNGDVVTQFNILAEVMIIDDRINKYYDRLDFGLRDSHYGGLTFYVYSFTELNIILNNLSILSNNFLNRSESIPLMIC